MVDREGRVGFVGLGSLGARLVERLVSSPFTVRVFDVRRDAMAPFADRAELAATLPDLVEGADVVGVCVQNDAQLREVVSGPGGLLDGQVKPGLVIAVHSTVHPATCREQAELVSARGAVLIDAAISNGGRMAGTDSRVVVVGGSVDEFERCRPYFETIGDVVEHAGDLGAAEVVKLLNNLLMTANLGLAAEVLRLGDELGVRREVLVRTLLSGSGSSQGAFTLQRVERAAHNEVLLRKDVQLATGLLEPDGLSAGEVVTAAEAGLRALHQAALGASA